MCPRSDRSGGCSRIEAVVALSHIDHDRDAAGLRYRLECGYEGNCGNDDLVARFDSGRDQAEPQGVKSAGNPNAVVDVAVLGKGLLELPRRRVRL